MKHISVLTRKLQDRTEEASYWRERCSDLEMAISELADAILGLEAKYSYTPDDWVLCGKGSQAPSQNVQDDLNEVCDMARKVRK